MAQLYCKKTKQYQDSSFTQIPKTAPIHSWKCVKYNRYFNRGFVKSFNREPSQPDMVWSCKKKLQNINNHWNKQRERWELM